MRKKINGIFPYFFISIIVMAGMYFCFSDICLTSGKFWAIFKDYFPGITISPPNEINMGIMMFMGLLVYWILVYVFCRD